jgi:hypothetical protein
MIHGKQIRYVHIPDTVDIGKLMDAHVRGVTIPISAQLFSLMLVLSALPFFSSALLFLRLPLPSFLLLSSLRLSSPLPVLFARKTQVYK